MIVSQAEYLKFIEASGATITASGQALLTTAAPWIQARIEKIIGYPLPATETEATEFYPESLSNYEAGGDYLVGNWDLINGAMIAQSRGEQYRNILTVRNLPLRSVTEIRENLGAWDVAGGSFPDTSILPTNAYYIDQFKDGISTTGRIIRTHGIWTRQLRCVKVTYVYGLDQDEIDADYSDLKLAVCRSLQSFYIGTIMRSMAGATGGFVTSTGITDFSVAFADPRLLGLYFANDYALPPDVVLSLSGYVNMRRYF